MKRKTLILLASIAIGLTCLTGCNKQIVDWNYRFDRARVKINETWVDIELDKWTDYSDGEQLQLTLKDGTVMIVHSENCILYKGTLPNE